MPSALSALAQRLHLAREVPVGEHPPIARLALPDDRRLVAARARQVPVEAVGRYVELAVDEPARVRRLPIEHLAPGGHPFERAGLLLPEPGRSRVPRCRGLGCGGTSGECWRRRKASLFGEESFELVVHCHQG